MASNVTKSRHEKTQDLSPNFLDSLAARNDSKINGPLANILGEFQAISYLLGLDPRAAIIGLQTAIHKRSPILSILLKRFGPWSLLLLAGALYVRNFPNLFTASKSFVKSQLQFSVVVNYYDVLYDEVIALATELATTRSSSQLKASMGRESYYTWNRQVNGPADGPKVQYQPHYGAVQTFVYNRRTFYLETFNTTWEKYHVASSAHLELRCWALSDTPLRLLLQECRDRYNKSRENTTTIYLADEDSWGKGTSKPSRDMDSVSLEQDTRDQLISEIGRFLTPEGRRWYVAQGVPHRRGYLFWRPPGTGKTSCSIALAGHFGLDVYMLSFSDKKLDAKALNTLSANLPGRCIVLLEDIDSAGIRREGTKIEIEIEQGQGQARVEIDIPSGQRKDDKPKKEKRQPISLSNLLNVIDGVAAAEGRILILTTNTPDALDRALIRPGRCDAKIKFGYASKEVSRRLFCRIMSDPSEASQSSPSSQSIQSIQSGQAETATEPSEAGENESTEGYLLEISEPKPRTRTGVEALAARFADIVPDGEFTPAEVSGYLITRRDEMRAAVEGAEKWKGLEAQLEKEKEREKGKRGRKRKGKHLKRKGKGTDGEAEMSNGEEGKSGEEDENAASRRSDDSCSPGSWGSDEIEDESVSVSSSSDSDSESESESDGEGERRLSVV